MSDNPTKPKALDYGAMGLRKCSATKKYFKASQRKHDIAGGTILCLGKALNGTDLVSYEETISSLYNAVVVRGLSEARTRRRNFVRRNAMTDFFIKTATNPVQFYSHSIVSIAEGLFPALNRGLVFVQKSVATMIIMQPIARKIMRGGEHITLKTETYVWPK